MCPRVTFNNFQNEAQQRYGTESTVQWWILPIGGYWNKKYAFLAKEFKTVLSRYADSLENRTKKRSEKISVWKYRHRKHHIAERHEPIRGDERKYLLLASILRSFRSRNTFQNVFLLLKLVISHRTSCWRPVSTWRICLKISEVFWRIVIWCPGLSQVFLDKLFEKNTLFLPKWGTLKGWMTLVCSYGSSQQNKAVLF